SAIPDADFEIFRAIDGEIPEDTDLVAAWLITGSASGVYDGDPWIDALRDFCKRLLDEEKPTVGICFGHQILAEAAGGRVEKSK
ncbi:GMP synthase, partial [Enterococcus hirae]